MRATAAQLQPLPSWQGCSEKSSKGSNRRLFTRVTSLAVVSLLNHVCGACVLVNCKSGVDRTGMYTALQLMISSVWELHPAHRWLLHLTLVNFNLVNGRATNEQDPSCVTSTAQPIPAVLNLATPARPALCARLAERYADPRVLAALPGTRITTRVLCSQPRSTT